MLKVTATEFADLLVVEPKIFGDERGYFFESYNREGFRANGIMQEFVQDNESFSRFGTLRGLHFQIGEHAQTKLIRAIQGKILDVAVDIRAGSKTYGRHFSIELTGENKKQLLVPKGFAHGFSVLSPTAMISYKCDTFYSPKNEGGIIYNDPDLKIDWRLKESEVILSDKDRILPRLKDLKA